jgi:hypothetical protein
VCPRLLSTNYALFTRGERFSVVSAKLPAKKFNGTLLMFVRISDLRLRPTAAVGHSQKRTALYGTRRSLAFNWGRDVLCPESAIGEVINRQFTAALSGNGVLRSISKFQLASKDRSMKEASSRVGSVESSVSVVGHT